MKTSDPTTPHLGRPTLLALAMAGTLCVGGAHAGRLDYRLELTGLHSDNINLSENNQADESVIIPTLAFDFQQEGAAVEIRARGEVERRHYFGNEFDDETRSRFAGQLNWAVLPQRMHFVLEDYLSEESINFRDGRYPGNLQQVNIFLGGPSFYARLNDATRLQLDLRAVDTYAEVAQGFDSRRYSAAAMLRRDLNARSGVSLQLAATKVDFDEAGELDYTRQDGFVRYEGSLRNVDYQFDLGRSRLDRRNASDESTSLARGMVEWRITPQSRLRARARRQFADEVQELTQRLSDPDEGLVPELVDPSSTLVSGGVYKQKLAEVDYRFNGERIGFRLRPRHREFEYLDQPTSNRTERGLLAQVSYRVTPLTSVVVSGTNRERDFDTGQEDRDRIYSIGIEQQRTRHWGWRAEAIHNERSSNQPDPEYKEKAVLLTVWWKR